MNCSLKIFALFFCLLVPHIFTEVAFAENQNSTTTTSELVAQLTEQLKSDKQQIWSIERKIDRIASKLATDDKQLTDARQELLSINDRLKKLKAKQQNLGKLTQKNARQSKAVVLELSTIINNLNSRQRDLRELIAWRIPLVFAEHPKISAQLLKLNLAKRRYDELYTTLIRERGETTPAAYLPTLPKPIFRNGHELPPLTRYGWSLPLDVNTILARNWGYALEMGGYWTQRNADRLALPFSKEARLVALAKAEKLKVFAITNRERPKTFPSKTWTRNWNGRLLLADARSYDGTKWHPGIKTVISPEAPDSVWLEYGRLRADPIARLRKQMPIAVVVNGGEYGIGVMGFAAKAWILDPAIRAAKKDDSWFEYISKRKGHAETLIANQVRKAVPDRELYVYYNTGNPHRKRYPWYWIWGYDFKYLKPVSDLASNAHYFKEFNSGFKGKEDMLTMATNVKAYDIANGQPLDYSWFWGKQTDIGRWMGFLKCLYVTGTIGGNSGWYKYTKFAAPFPVDSPPAWLKDMIALARVHALFSYLEDDIRKGELVAGPYWHTWSRELPAYELVPKTINKSGTEKSKSDLRSAKPGRRLRVIARKRTDMPRWLIATWAAFGEASEVTVDLPGYGTLKLLARPAGSVYLLDTRKDDKQLVLVDSDALMPSRSAAKLFSSNN